MRNLHQLFVLCTASQIIGGDFAKFVAFLEHMNSTSAIEIFLMQIKKRYLTPLCMQCRPPQFPFPSWLPWRGPKGHKQVCQLTTFLAKTLVDRFPRAHL